MQGASLMARGPGYASHSLLVLWMIASIALPAVAFLLRSAKGAQHVADMALLHKRVGDHV